MLLADEGNYRETRFFAIWQKDNEMQDFLLPKSLHHIQKTTLFGIGLLQTNDTIIGQEICEEMWAAENPSTYLVDDGAEIITNSSGSHHTLRKLDRRLHLIKNTTAKLGGVYVYANH